MADGRTTITTRVKRVTWFTAPLLQTQLLPEPVSIETFQMMRTTLLRHDGSPSKSLALCVA